jgi:outer membrane lipoprotein-sorting protein
MAMVKTASGAIGVIVCAAGCFVLLAGAGRTGRTLCASPQAADTPKVSDYTTALADITASIHITESDSKEMAKIGSDFATTYSFHTMSLLYKQPDKLRLDGKSPTRGTLLTILNGPNLFVDVPRFKIHITENLEKYPTRRQSLLELGGVISPSTLKFMNGTYVRPETVDGHATAVFDMHYTGVESGSHYRVWLDSTTHTTVKREWFNSENQLRATFLYDEPKEVSAGMWLPTRVQIKNADGVVGAVLTMEDIRVNQGLVDGLFTIPS